MKKTKTGNNNQQQPKKRKRLYLGEYDLTVIFVVILLMLFGIIMIASASYYNTMTSELYSYDMFYFPKRQLRWAIVGIVALIFTMRVPYQFWKRLSVLMYLGANGLLVLVLLLATATKGQKRWLFGFQPSEVAKVAVIFFLAFYLSTHKDCLKDLKGFVKCMVLLGIPVALIALANLSTALLVTMVGVTMIFLASPKVWYFVACGGAMVPLVALAMIPEQFRYRLGRVTTWLDPFSPDVDGYQIIQSLYAVASGGLFGLGLGQSRQKTFLPEPHNDFIFAIICEELGLIGAGLVILLFGVLVWRGAKIALGAKDQFSMLTAVGITCTIGYQALINMAVSTNSIPNTGQPLPFISYGGSSLLIMLFMVGVLLNISRSASAVEKP